ncbi:hypothetical protein LXL04_017615 [Taraxacum kok-saghyz]
MSIPNILKKAEWTVCSIHTSKKQKKSQQIHTKEEESIDSSRSGEKKNFGEKKIDSKHVNLKLPPSAIQQAGDEERRGRLQGAARRFRLQGAARRFRLQRWFVLKLSREGDEEERRSRPSFTVALSRSRDGSSIRG